MPGSETEKRGVSSGCRFSDKAGHVPIKKRRFLLRSPSPPPVQTSPCVEETADHTGNYDIPDKFVSLHSSSSDTNFSQVVDTNNNICAKKSASPNKGFREDEDFSGISILAAAACNSSLGRDCGHAEDGSGIEESSALERARDVSTNTETWSSSKVLSREDVLNSSEMSCGATSSCKSIEPVGELALISTIANSSQKVASVGNALKDASLGLGSLTFSGGVSCGKDEEIVRSQRLSSQDRRLHWDLNVVMDAWEQPFDDPGAPSDLSHNISQDVGNSNHDEDIELKGHDLRENAETEYAAQSCLLAGEPRASANQCSVESKDWDDMDSCSDVNQPLCLGEKFPSSNSNFNLEVMKCMVEDTDSERQEETANPTGELAVAAQTIQSSALCTLNETEDASVKSLALKSDVGVSSFQLQNLASFGALAADTDITLSVSCNPDTLKEVKQTVAVPDLLDRPKNFHLEGNSLIENIDHKTEEPQEHAEFAISEDNGLPDTEAPMSERCELLVTLDTKVKGVSNIQGDNVVCNNGTINNLSDIYTATPKESCDAYYHEACNTNLDSCSNYFENIDNEGSHNYKNDVGAQRLPVLEGGTDAAGELQEDYDSQYEDGELRESSGHAWGEYDVVEKEAGNVDYVSNYGETHIANPSDYHVVECRKVEDRKSGEPVIAPAVSLHDSIVDNESYRKVSEENGNERGCDEGNQIKTSHVVEKIAPTQRNELLESRKSFSEVATQGADENGRNSKMPTHNDALLDAESTDTRAEHKSFRRGLQSQIEAPVARHDEYKGEQLKSRFETGTMRSFERMRYPIHNQGRGWQGGNWNDGSSDSRRGIRRHYSPIIHGHSKLDDDAVVERDDVGCVGTQRDASYSQQFLSKGRAGVEGEPCAGFHSRYKPDRKFSPDRVGGFGRGRPFRPGTFVEGRGGRGRFNGPFSDEIFQSSLKYRRPLSRRERSISPFEGRGQSNMHHSHRKSPSRSRSRSPIVWNSPRRKMGAGSGGNTFVGHRSRSPNLRFEGRMQRPRSPHQQPVFGADHAGGFRSISRNHGSPPHNRWSFARKDEQGQFRELAYKRRTSALDRSPGRIRLSGERSSAIDSSRNLKPDGYYRISDRGPDNDGRVRYEENFEERKKQYHFFRPARRNYDDGVASRLRQDNDGFSMRTSFRDRDDSSFQDNRGLKGIDGRIGNLPRRFRGENQSFIFEREGKFNPNSKQFGVDPMDSSHNLKSEEQYRPNYDRRFSTINGANRGFRYENYGDRRKQNGPANIIRRCDNEDSEKRLHHNENFEETPEICSRVTRGFDGRIGSLSTRLMQDEGPIVGGQEEKLDGSTE